MKYRSSSSPGVSVSVDPEPVPGGRPAFIWLSMASVLLVFALLIHWHRNPFFTSLITSGWAGFQLVADSARPVSVLLQRFSELIRLFFSGFLLPVYFLLLPGICLLARGLGRKAGRWWDAIAQIAGRPVFPAAIFVLTLLAGIAVRLTVTGNLPPVGDEFTYAFQANLFSSGRLHASSPPVADAFACWSIIHSPHWCAKVTPGWPLLLAPGLASGLEALVNPLLAAGAVVLLYRIGRRLAGAEGGMLAAGAAVLSPVFILQTGTLFPHCATVFFMLLWLDGLLAIPDAASSRPAWLAGMALAWLILIRPGDAAVLAIGGLPMLIHGIVHSPRRLETLLRSLAILPPALTGLAALLLYNLIQHGGPLTFGYSLYDPGDRWGLGVHGHSVATALWNTIFSWMRNAFWTTPFVFLLALCSLRRRDTRFLLLWIPAALLTLFYAGFYSLGAFEAGARYHLPAFVLLLVPAAGGLLWLRDFLSRRLDWSSALPLAAAAVTLVFMMLAVYPVLLPAVNQQYYRRAGLARWISGPPNIPDRSILFLRNHADLANIFLTRNIPEIGRQKNLVLLYLTPEINRAVLQAFPGRTPWTVDYAPAAGRFQIQAGIDLAATSENFQYAAYNYAGFNRIKALAAFQQALAAGPCPPEMIVTMGQLYENEGVPGEACQLYRLLETSPAYRPAALFRTARCLDAMGRRQEARQAFLSCAASCPGTELARSAFRWAERMREENP